MGDVSPSKPVPCSLQVVVMEKCRWKLGLNCGLDTWHRALKGLPDFSSLLLLCKQPYGRFWYFSEGQPSDKSIKPRTFACAWADGWLWLSSLSLVPISCGRPLLRLGRILGSLPLLPPFGR